jgi:UDP-N-acetylmuramate--alanine ligase
VIEADEYDRAFLSLEPEIAIVTNIEHDHIDVFPTHDDVKEAFARFASGIVRGGWLVACADDPAAAALAARGEDDLAGRQVATYGMAPSATYRVVELVQGPEGVSFDLVGPSASLISVSLRLAGAHNARNAAGALVVADALGIPAAAAAKSFATFNGTERRLEELGSAWGITVVDDYAHHPTEIRASIEAVRARTRGRVIVLFQPHTPSRLRAFFDDFAAALRTADARVVAETFASARETPDSRAGAKALAARAGGAYVVDAEAAARGLAELARPGDLVLVLGAGDIRPAGIRLLELLRERAIA